MVVLVIAVLYHLRDELDCQYNANNSGDDTLYFPDQRGKLSDLVAMDCIRDEESIYSRNRMSRMSHICCNVSLT